MLLGRRTTVREDGSERPLLWHVPNCWQEAKGSDPAAYHFYSVVRQGRWKLIYQQSDQSFELYDLEADISETTNLAKRLPGKVDELRKVMGNLLRERGAQMPHIGSASGSLVPWPDEVPLKLGGLTLRN